MCHSIQGHSGDVRIFFAKDGQGFVAEPSHTYTVAQEGGCNISGPAGKIFAEYFDKDGYFDCSYKDWCSMAQSLTDLWFPQCDAPVAWSEEHKDALPEVKNPKWPNANPPPPCSGEELVPDFRTPGLTLVKRPANDAEEAEWRADASAGLPTSAGKPAVLIPSPAVLTPSPRSGYFDVPTPEKVPLPMSKCTLVADRKLQQELKKMKRGKENDDKHNNNDDGGGDKANDKSKPKEKKEGKTEKAKKSDKTQKTELPNKRCGPMQPAMKEFIRKQKTLGKTHVEARELWLQSAERERIVSQVSEGERKKRRW